MRTHRLLSIIAGELHMPPALDTVTAQGTAIGATIAALAAAGGDSLQVKNAALTSDVLLLNVWPDVQVAGSVRVRSPKLHDNVDGIRSRTRLNGLEPILPFGQPQRLFPQDNLIVELAGSAVAGDIESLGMLIYYADMPGQAAHLISVDELKRRFKNYFGNRLAITVGSTAAYTGSRAINGDVDLLKANIDYAVLGFTTDVRVGSICLRGPDTGNLRVSSPGPADVNGVYNRYATWFLNLSRAYGLPLIPVINAANKGATNIDVFGDENGGTANVTIWLAELS